MTIRVNPDQNGTNTVLELGDVTAGDGLEYERGESSGTLSLTTDVVRGSATTTADVPLRMDADGQWVINWDYYTQRADDTPPAGVPGAVINNESLNPLTKLTDGDVGHMIAYNDQGRPVYVEPTNGVGLEPTVAGAMTLEFDYVAKQPNAVQDPPVLADFNDGAGNRRRFLFVYA